LTQEALGGRIDLSQAEVSRLERGRGAGASIETWVAIGMALDRPISVGFSRDVVDPHRLDDLGAALRSTDRNLVAARRTSASASSLWILVDSAANREIVRRYPTLLRSRFLGSSAAWVRALGTTSPPPSAPGLIWAEPRSSTLRALRIPDATRHTRSS
jgi:transcriptional regulator with XRE-family HTH domain